MRNPGLRLVGLTTSPSGGGVFGTRAEEELRHWLESRLDALGIDPVAYSRFVLSLLRRPPDSALSPLDEDIDFAVVNRPAGGGGAGAGGRRHHHRVRPRARISGDRDQRRAVVQCLTNAADQKCGVEPLVDELCAKLRNLEGSSGSTNDTSDTETEESKRKNLESVNNSKFETLTPRDKALRYYAAFPALQPATPKKNNNNYNHNNNNIINNNNNNNNNNYNINKNNNNLKKDKTYSATINNLNKKNYNNKNKKNDKKRKTKMSIRTIDHKEDKGTFGFAKSMERERDNDRESEMDKIKLQELQAKFDHSLEALWDSGPGNAGDKASIWAAPSLSIPSGPLWPVDPTELLILPIIHDDDDNDDEDDDDVINDEDSSINCKKIINSCNNTPYFYNNHCHVSDDGTIADNETVIPWDIGIIGVGKFIDDSKDKIDYNLNWSDYGGDGPWNWKDLGNNLITIDNPKINSFYSSPHDDINLIIKQQRQQKEQQQYLSATNDYKEKLNNLKNEIDGNKIINNDGGNFVELKLKNEQEQKQEVEAKVIEVIEDKEQVRIEVKNKASENVKVEQSEVEEEEEDLLTSARTHFRPIKDDGNWVDGTTFPVNNNYESVNYRRSSCGNLLYLPNDDNPYMEYHETITAPLSSSSASNTSTTAAAGDGTAVRNFTLKFRVKQCDKSIQTDPIRSPVKRRIIAEPDRHFYYTKLINNLGDDDNGDLHADDDDDDDDDDEEDDDDNVNTLTQESYDIDKDSFMLDHMHWKQPSLSLLNDRKRRHSSSFNCRPLATLRPLTL